jgi:hypothetical protein
VTNEKDGEDELKRKREENALESLPPNDDSGAFASTQRILPFP